MSQVLRYFIPSYRKPQNNNNKNKNKEKKQAKIIGSYDSFYSALLLHGTVANVFSNWTFDAILETEI